MSRKLYLNSDDFSVSVDGYTYVPSAKIVDAFENLRAIRVDKVVLTMENEPETGSILISSNAIGRKMETKTPISGQNHNHILCSVTPDSRNAVTIETTTQSNQNNSSVTDSDIEAIGSSLKLWIDMSPERVLDSAFQPTNSIGDVCRYVYNRSPAESGMVFSANVDFQVAQIGSARGINSGESWSYLIDSSMPNFWDSESFTICFLITMPSSLTSTVKIFNFYSCVFKTKNPGVVYIEDAAGNDQSTNLQVIPLNSYLYTVTRSDNDGDGIYTMNVTQERLSTSEITTGIETPSGKPVAASTNWWFSDASIHFTQTQGPMVAFEGTDSTHTVNSQSYLRALYNGNSTSNSSSSTENTNAFQWISKIDVTLPVTKRTFQELDLNFSTPISKFSIEFTLEY